MALVVEARKILNGLVSLGPKRLWQLAIAGVGVSLAIGVASYFASRPSFEVLYAGLDSQDAARITAVLRETSVPFDLSSDGTSILVEYGQASRARMALAERGLPRSGTAGYELFDKLGSLGLTSFMQEMTRVRALEGELARSIQSMQGVRAARVHIAPQDEGGFRRSKLAASASVVVRLSSSAERNVAQAIRRLVAAATPGLTIDAVTVLSADGAVLAAGGDAEQSASVMTLGLQKSLSDALQDNIRQTLAPIVGVRNLNVSVALRLNTDKRQVNETVFNPESRVERSIRVIKESQSAQNSNGQPPTSVERNIPGDKPKADGKSSSEENSKKEEVTNYEVSSKSIQTIGGAYAIERISIAVLVNKSAIASIGEAKDEAALQKKIVELKELASTAAGLMPERGDTIKLSAIDYAEGMGEASAVGEPGVAALVARQVGSILHALALMVAAAIAGFVAYRVLTRQAQPKVNAAEQAVAELTGPTADAVETTPVEPPELPAGQRKRAQQRLEALISADEQQAARVLKDWLRVETQAIHESA